MSSHCVFRWQENSLELNNVLKIVLISKTVIQSSCLIPRLIDLEIKFKS